MARILGVLAIILLLSLCIFAIPPDGDRLGNALTVLLTITAYTLVVGDSLPTLGYLTFLDQFTLISYACIG